jgi:hypothetical protein
LGARRYSTQKTLRVDMPIMRQHGLLRILIGCMDYVRIPKVNMFCEGWYLWSKFQGRGIPNHLVDEVMVEDPNGHDDEHGFVRILETLMGMMTHIILIGREEI